MFLPIATLNGRFESPLVILIFLAFFGLSGASLGASLGAEQGVLATGKVVSPPYGAVKLCDRYLELCDGSSRLEKTVMENTLALAARINAEINARYPQRSDMERFGQDDFWAPVDSMGGDCEDFALRKKRELLDHGVPFSRLRIATVLDSELRPHAVLLIRINGTDFVLDNMVDDIVDWRATAYTFVRVEDPTVRGQWRMVVGPASLLNF